jgi:hypothetical protein
MPSACVGLETFVLFGIADENKNEANVDEAIQNSTKVTWKLVKEVIVFIHKLQFSSVACDFVS